MPPRLVALRPGLATAADRYDHLRTVVDALVGRGVVEPSLARTRWPWTAAGQHDRRPVPPAAVLYEWLLDRGPPPQSKAPPTPWPADGPAWLGAELASRVARTLGEGDWLAQEWVGATALGPDPALVHLATGRLTLPACRGPVPATPVGGPVGC